MSGGAERRSWAEVREAHWASRGARLPGPQLRPPGPTVSAAGFLGEMAKGRLGGVAPGPRDGSRLRARLKAIIILQPTGSGGPSAPTLFPCIPTQTLSPHSVSKKLPAPKGRRAASLHTMSTPLHSCSLSLAGGSSALWRRREFRCRRLCAVVVGRRPKRSPPGTA